MPLDFSATNHRVKQMFTANRYKIPSDKPDKSLKRRVSEFLDHDDKYTLLIVYYAGHARCAMQANEAPLWFAYVSRSKKEPRLTKVQ